MQALRWIGFALAAALLAVALISGVNTACFGQRDAGATAPTSALSAAPDAATLEWLAGAVRFPTASYEGGRYDPKAFDGLAAHLGADRRRRKGLRVGRVDRYRRGRPFVDARRRQCNCAPRWRGLAGWRPPPSRRASSHRSQQCSTAPDRR